MDFAFTDEQEILHDSVRKLMNKHAPPDYVRRLDRAQEYPDALYGAWVEVGLLRLPFPEAYGGLGGNAVDLVIVAEELARKSPDFFMAWSGSVFCGLNLMLHGSEGQKRYWLPRLFSGEIKFSISMSEPDDMVANLGMQIFGGYGCDMEFDMQRHFRDARAATIAAGTSQMQRNLIAGSMGLKVR